MTTLLVLTALLLFTSSLTKLRAAARAKIGVHVLSMLEIVAALGLLVLSLAGPLTAAQGMTAIVASVLLILVSSLHMGSTLGKKRRLRELTEGRRLENYVKYLSEQPDEAGPGGSPPGATPW